MSLSAQATLHTCIPHPVPRPEPAPGGPRPFPAPSPARHWSGPERPRSPRNLRPPRPGPSPPSSSREFMQGKYTASASKEAERLLRLCDRCMARPPAAVCRPILAERHPPLARYKKRGVLAAGLRAAGSAGRAARRGARLCPAASGSAPRSSAVPRRARLCPAALGGAGRRSQHGAAYQRGEQSDGGAGLRAGGVGRRRRARLAGGTARPRRL